MKAGRLRWKLSPHATGLARVCEGPRSSWLTDGVTRYACVSSLGRSRTDWYWTAGWDSAIPRINTCDAPQSLDDAKASAMAYVKAHQGAKQ